MWKKSPIKRVITGGVITENCIAWTAILAVLMMVLAPASPRVWSRYQNNRSDSFWMEICSTLVSQPALDAGTSSMAKDGVHPAPQRHDVAAYCFYCVMHADVIMPLSATLGSVMLTIFYFLPRLFYQSAQALFAWIVASSRAPPTVFLSR